MHTTGPRSDMSVSAMMSAWQIKMASESGEERGERRKRVGAREGREVGRRQIRDENRGRQR